MASRRKGAENGKAPKKVKVAKLPNPCLGAEVEKRTYPCDFYGVKLPFNPSNTQMQVYQGALGHKPVLNYQRHPPSPTYDEVAIRKLSLKYPDDPLYPLVGKHRELVKCMGTYVDGIGMGLDGRVHETFKHTPSTLRLAMQILQLLPRADDPESLYSKVRNLFVAAPGHQLAAVDYGGIEAKLVGYLAGDKDFLRLCNLGIHDFVASHAYGTPALVEWSDEQIKDHFAKLKRDGGDHYDVVRTGCKRAVYLSLYGGGPGEMVRREPTIFPTEASAKEKQDLVFALFPSIKKWHWRVAEECEAKGYVQSPSGFRLHGAGTITYKYDPLTKVWEKELAHPAKAAIASVPQHLAMCYMAKALAACWKIEWLRPYMRLSIHDEIMVEAPDSMVKEVIITLKQVMEQPMEFLPLPPEWGMGSHLVIGTEAKAGARWGQMKKV